MRSSTANTCCGVTELTEIGRASEKQLRDYTNLLFRENRPGAVIYYGVNTGIINKLRNIGFVAVTTFRNPSTGNVISVMVRGKKIPAPVKRKIVAPVKKLFAKVVKRARKSGKSV